jgi:L-ascorbate metabolism protein UlaG (beta-lactamase superfamily)
MTGDTVLHRPLRRLARQLDVDIVLMHLGNVRFPITGPLRYSMNSRDAASLLAVLGPRLAVPVHYDGWSHFSEPANHVRTTLDRADGVRHLVTWLEPGRPTQL